MQHNNINKGAFSVRHRISECTLTRNVRVCVLWLVCVMVASKHVYCAYVLVLVVRALCTRERFYIVMVASKRVYCIHIGVGDVRASRTSVIILFVCLASGVNDKGAPRKPNIPAGLKISFS